MGVPTLASLKKKKQPRFLPEIFFIEEDIQKAYNLEGIITLVGAKHVLDHIHEEKPEGVENECQEQVASSLGCTAGYCLRVHCL